MIQRHHDIVWVRQADGTTVPFDAGRLTESVDRAAVLAGHHESSLGESLAVAVEMFALRVASQPVVSADDIARFVETVLNGIGYTTIARMYGHRSRHVEIRLDDVAACVETGFELGFYQRLDEALDVAGDARKTLIQLRGLKPCVMKLRGAQRWSGDCVRLADEIVHHVRTRAARLRSQSSVAPVSLRLTVIE
jgi:hypothetical protein